jgi:AraC-like DNA-binding protein
MDFIDIFGKAHQNCVVRGTMKSSASTRPYPPGLQPDVPITEQGIVRVAAVLGIVPLLRERGFEPAKLLAHFSLDPHTLDHADNRIRYHTVGRLLKYCAEVTSCAHFGLLVGQQNNVLLLGTLGELMLCSPTVHLALRSLILNTHLQTRGGVPTYRVEGDSAILGYAIYQRGMLGTAQVNDLVMAYEFNILRALGGARWYPQEVSFSHAKPADIRPYRKFFRAPLRFDADRSEIRFDKTWLDNPLPGHDADLHSHLQRELATELMLEPDDYAEQVQRALRTTIPSGRGSETVIAELMSLPVRTLRWRLARQGTSFKKLIEQVRYEIARQLLLDTQMNTAEIAESLNYADASSFTRAFRRWTDAPPATWRENFRSAEAGFRVAARAIEKRRNSLANS